MTSPAATRIASIPTEITHQGTTHVKRLIRPSEKHADDIATMNYAWLEPGRQLTPHTHPDGEEFYLFLEGHGEILVGNTWVAVEKMHFVTIPVSTTHSVKNTGNTDLILVTIRTVKNEPCIIPSTTFPSHKGERIIHHLARLKNQRSIAK